MKERGDRNRGCLLKIGAEPRRMYNQLWDCAQGTGEIHLITSLQIRPHLGRILFTQKISKSRNIGANSVLGRSQPARHIPGVFLIILRVYKWAFFLSLARHRSVWREALSLAIKKSLRRKIQSNLTFHSALNWLNIVNWSKQQSYLKPMSEHFNI